MESRTDRSMKETGFSSLLKSGGGRVGFSAPVGPRVGSNRRRCARVSLSRRWGFTRRSRRPLSTWRTAQRRDPKLKTNKAMRRRDDAFSGRKTRSRSRLRERERERERFEDRLNNLCQGSSITWKAVRVYRAAAVLLVAAAAAAAAASSSAARHESGNASHPEK